ncbi:hypothetical protein PSCLAVI8L_20026 [Pseudoclavibacter sp. 8L]|nr:hypothetical protein PSCLAVI8L_20026 [Pseudoclavibacter sp. 8L]
MSETTEERIDSPAACDGIGTPTFEPRARDGWIFLAGLLLFWGVYNGPPVPELAGIDLRLGMAGPAASNAWKWLGALLLIALVLWGRASGACLTAHHEAHQQGHRMGLLRLRGRHGMVLDRQPRGPAGGEQRCRHDHEHEHRRGPAAHRHRRRHGGGGLPRLPAGASRLAPALAVDRRGGEPHDLHRAPRGVLRAELAVPSARRHPGARRVHPHPSQPRGDDAPPLPDQRADPHPDRAGEALRPQPMARRASRAGGAPQATCD